MFDPHLEQDPLASLVYVVDDDAHSRKSVELLLQTIGVHVLVFASAQEFLAEFDATRPGCLILDMRMPGMSGLELLRRLREMEAPIPVIMITAHGEVSMAVEAMKAGAIDFLEKPYSPQTLLDRVHHALKELAVSRHEFVQRTRLKAQLAKLSARETEVMGLLIEGKNTKQISTELEISEKTVDFHRRNLLVKMSAGSVVELARLIQLLEQFPTPIGWGN